MRGKRSETPERKIQEMVTNKAHYRRYTSAATSGTSATLTLISAPTTLVQTGTGHTRRPAIILDRLIISANTAGAITLEHSGTAILPVLYVPATTTIQLADIDIRTSGSINMVASGSACTVVAQYFIADR